MISENTESIAPDFDDVPDPKSSQIAKRLSEPCVEELSDDEIDFVDCLEVQAEYLKAVHNL